MRALLERLGSPEEIVAAAASDGPLLPASLAREGWAVGLMTAGSFLPVLGWLAGVGLMWTSRVWTRRDKLLGTLVMPLGPLGLVYAGGFLAASRAECGPEIRTTRGDTTSVTRICEGGSIIGLPSFLDLVVLVVWGAASVAVSWTLWARARSRGRGPAASRSTPWSGLEITAVVLMSAGTFLFPFCASLAGLVLALCSRQWRLWEKAVATVLCLAPVGLLVSFYLTEGDLFGAQLGNSALLISFVGTALLSAAAALFLGLRLRGRSAPVVSGP